MNDAAGGEPIGSRGERTVQGAHVDTAMKATAWGAVALALVVLVGMAAHGAAWSEHRDGDVRSLPHGVIVAAGAIAFCAAAVLFVLVVLGARGRETPDQRQKRWRNAIALLIFLAAIAVFETFFHPSHSTRVQHGPPGGAASPTASAPARNDRPTTTTWWPLVIVGFTTAGIFLVATARRSNARSGRGAGGMSDTAATVAMVEASLDDLRSEPDARRAVTAAYARMEHGLAARGFAREASETPTEYFRRALAANDGIVVAVSIEPLRELTALAERARFSALPIDEPMRARAIAALESLRTELRRESLAALIGSSEDGDRAI